MRHSRYRYFDEVRWAEAFMDGELLFRSLSHYHQIEDGEVRGDASEGSVSFRPKGGLIGTNQTQGKPFHWPDGSSFDSSVNPEEIFILCASASMSDELRDRFKAKAMVEIRKVATLCARIRAQLPSTATFRAQRVMYYTKENEIGVKYAFPDMIAFSKVAETYGWQDEYRFCFSLTDALKYGKTVHQVRIPSQLPGAPPAAPPLPRAAFKYPLAVGSLGDICELVKF